VLQQLQVVTGRKEDSLCRRRRDPLDDQPRWVKLTEVYRDDTRRYAITPTWSPNGSMIMFALDPTGNPFGHPRNSLYVIGARGGGLTKVLGGRDFKREPFWVPR
jgi:hypothetical protein